MGGGLNSLTTMLAETRRLALVLQGFMALRTIEVHEFARGPGFGSSLIGARGSKTRSPGPPARSLSAVGDRAIAFYFPWCWAQTPIVVDRS